jgi:hypothetical protein
MAFWIAITAIATAVIAWSTWSNNKLAKEIKETREKQDEETKDLFQAMVIANIASGPHDYSESLRFFKENRDYPLDICIFFF